MFADGSSLIILNKTKCEENSECSGEKEIDLKKHGCNILPNKIQYLQNDAWKAFKITQIKKGSFEITAGKPLLKVFKSSYSEKNKRINQELTYHTATGTSHY